MEPIYVVGAGGIGCAVGHTLCAAGAAVTLVDANPDKVRWGRAHGVHLSRHPPQRATFLHFEDWQPGAAATVLLCTKCYDNTEVLSRVPASVRIIPIQNGFDGVLDRSRGAPEGIASFVSECTPDRTHTRITRNGRLHLGFRGEALSLSPGKKPADRESDFYPFGKEFQKRAPFAVQRVPDILPYKYTKLMYNAAISPLAAAAGLDNGQLLSLPKARQLFFALLRENYAILRSAKIRLAKIGPFHPDAVDRILRRVPVARLLAWFFSFSLRKTYCSMSGDLPRGKTEIDYYNRHLIDLAGDFPCPLNRRIYALVKRMEQERIKPSLDILDRL
jgi:2-dehydropantoate 2-reductase